MASQITHVAYAKHILERFLSGQKIDEKRYYIGTLFPDIRYLGALKREQTHISDPSIEQLIQIDNDFEKGIYVHSLVDLEREKTLIKLGVYEDIEENGLNSAVMKFVEDEYTYELINDWSVYTKFLEEILPDEEILVSTEIVNKWHTILRQYFSKPPTIKTIADFSQNLQTFDAQTIERAKASYQEIKSNKKVLDIIRETLGECFS